MDLEELRAQTSTVINDLECILETYRISETEIYFVNHKDIEFIEGLIEGVNSHKEKEALRANRHKIGPDEMKPHKLLKEDKKILNRIVKHAEQYKKSGVVRYRIQDDYMTSNEIKEAIKKYLDSKFLNKSDSKFLVSVFHFLDEHNLSAKQTIFIENLFDIVDEKTKKEKSGIIYFNPTGDLEIYTMGNRVINYALGRGRIPNIVSGEDVIEAKDKYLREGEAGLDKLRERLRIEMAGKKGLNNRIFSKYESVIKLLEKYMAVINLDSYVIDGLKCAIPKHLVQQD